MAVYKVIQDIEAEDKLLGPLTLKQFVYAAIAVVFIFVDFKLIVSPGLGIFRWVAVLFFSLPMVLFAVLASPLGRDQPTELWLLSHLKFMLRPRQRRWDQEGIVQTVRITAPKRADVQLTKNLTQGEVQSRLEALASMLDSRGWAIQSTVGVTQPTEPTDTTERLLPTDVLGQTEQPLVDVRAGDDLLDESTNDTAQRYGALVREVEEQKKHELAQKVETARTTEPAPAAPPANWGIQNLATAAPQIVKPDVATPAGGVLSISHQKEADLAERLKSAEGQFQASHSGQVTSLAAERQRRAIQDGAVGENGNFSVATLSKLANREGGAHIKSMPF